MRWRGSKRVKKTSYFRDRGQEGVKIRGSENGAKAQVHSPTFRKYPSSPRGGSSELFRGTQLRKKGTENPVNCLFLQKQRRL